MQRSAHGRFTIQQLGDVFLLTFHGTWNLEGAKRFFQEYSRRVEDAKLAQFGVVSDLSDLEGATPDALESFDQISSWASQRGQRARAVVVDNGFKKYLISRIDQHERPYPVEFFSSIEEALDWLRSQGLGTSPEEGASP